MRDDGVGTSKPNAGFTPSSDAPSQALGLPDLYNYGYLDEQTKSMVRRAILKAIAIPGYQVPFSSKEMPMPMGWGTGGVQLTASIIGPQDVLKVIDQGADDTTNAVSLRSFFEKVTRVKVTTRLSDATIVQTRHRIPEQPMRENQVLVYQVPIPEPLQRLEPKIVETRKMHANADYGLMHVKIYEDVAKHGTITINRDYPVMVEDRYLMAPTPIPSYDNPKMNMMPCLQLFGSGTQARIYAVPPYSKVASIDFDDHRFRIQTFVEPCALCGSKETYLDEMVIDDHGGRMFVCSDTDNCEQIQSGSGNL